MENAMTQRRSFRMIGGAGTYDIEIVRLEGSGLEVRQTDSHGAIVPGVQIVHTWDEARDLVAARVAEAIREGMV